MPLISNLSASLTSLMVFLAQEKAEAPGAPVAPAPGTGPAPQGGGGGMFGGSIMFPLLMCLAVLYLFIFLPDRRKQKARQAMVRNVKKGDRVVTTSGILAKVVRVDEREVVLQVDKDNDVRIPFLKSAIHEVIPEGAEAGEGPPPPKEGAK